MASLRAPTSLTSLPTELLVSICQDLAYNDVQALRSSSHHFISVLPPPSDKQIQEAKTSAKEFKQTLIACGGCLRLLPHKKFSTRMLIGQRRRSTIPADAVGGSPTSDAPGHPSIASPPRTSDAQRKERFCNDCGCRDLPGRYRFQRGDFWDNVYGVWFLRCERCGVCKRIVPDKDMPMRRVPVCRRCLQLAEEAVKQQNRRDGIVEEAEVHDETLKRRRMRA